MTGFGRGEHATSALIARVELTSINRKQAEVIVQMPRIYTELEAEIRKLALEKISRGRLNINIQLEPATDASTELKLDTAKVLALQAEIQRLNHLTVPGLGVGLGLKLTTADILRLPDILTTADNTADIETARAAIFPALTAGLESLMTMRASEGSHLKKDTLDRLSILESEAENIESHAPAVLKKYRENLHKRLSESGLEIDLTDERILKEIGLFAEKCDISEEITRLSSHFQKFREYLATDQPVGRSLDFLCQELNREFNTIGSKANDATLAQHVVNAKTELEKIREQIQNVE